MNSHEQLERQILRELLLTDVLAEEALRAVTPPAWEDWDAKDG